jgi:hypothetical protein
MASSKDADFFTLPTVLETANAICTMWELDCPEEELHRIPHEMRAPTHGTRPQEPHDRERIATIQCATHTYMAISCWS